jgi:ssDNA-binding Zn-finger/Zn-ribbon topoisomerase 1
MQGYCVKCKTSREMKNLTYTKASNGRTMAKGVCPVCGTKMNKFLSKEEADKHPVAPAKKK